MCIVQYFLFHLAYYSICLTFFLHSAQKLLYSKVDIIVNINGKVQRAVWSVGFCVTLKNTVKFHRCVELAVCCI